MSSVLYYSKFCNHCKELITKNSKKQRQRDEYAFCLH